MTDRHNAYLVVLESDIREDNAADIIRALSLIRGVAEVKPVIGGIETTMEQMVARARIKLAFTRMIGDLFANFDERMMHDGS
jgi:hypothetical protein